MSDEWKDEKCGTCAFNVKGLCRQAPPHPLVIGAWISAVGILKPNIEWSYPHVEDDDSACYCWGSRQNNEDFA